MFLRFTGLLLLVSALSSAAGAQQKPRPSPTPLEDDTPVKVFTEEVRLQVFAVDQFGHYDPTVVPEDILILEDGVAQQIKSVRHIPSNVVLVLDTGGESIGLGGISKHPNLTRDVAIELLRRLPETTTVATMQFNNTATVLQTWTTDRQATLKALRTKLSSGKRARFADGLMAAAELLKDRPEGTRHVVLITDGVETPGGKTDRALAMKKLAATRSTVHVISYTELVRQKNDKTRPKLETGQMPVSRDPISANDPTNPPGTTRSPTFGVSVRFDPAMRRLRKAYEADVKKSQVVLETLANESGGQIFLPKSSDEMMSHAREAAREIGSEYVVTYRPKRALAFSPGEYRKVDVASRRVGLTLRSRRGYLVPSP